MTQPAAPSEAPPAKRRLVTLSSGGWVIIASITLTCAVIAWQLNMVFSHLGSRAVGDGKDPATYGFDLSTCLVDMDQLSGSGAPKNRMRVLQDPVAVPASWVKEWNAVARGKFLVSSDLVIGVEQGGEARAYPICMLNWHEIVNDTLGGQPIAVTWSPWSGGAAVFSRAQGDEVLDFGFSGLLFNSTQLLFDRREQREGVTNPESLWSQVQARAIAGPAAAAGRRLQPLASSLTTWKDWQASHPGTTVISPVGPDTGVYLKRHYNSNPYGPYVNDDLRIDYAQSTHPLPPADGLPYKTTILVVGIGDERRAYPLPWLAERAGAAAVWTDQLAGKTLEFRVGTDPLTGCVSCADGDLQVRYVYWFAWFACNPEDPGLAK